AVDDQKRRIVFRDVGHRRSGPGDLLLILDPAADQLALRGIRAVVIHLALAVLHGEYVRGAEQVHDALHPAARVLVFAHGAFPILVPAAGAEHGDQMPARRLADDADLVRVEVVFLGVGTNPADGRLAVVDLGRPDRLAREPVADRNRRVLA